ncbi:hypothetical protein SLS55_003665 [Diplodia seriata]|uniref:Uncharacterized protein n=1 Tax=Diplodia seriata TaxID=420778 RepID=A0ABR3CNL3_9PEZI
MRVITLTAAVGILAGMTTAVPTASSKPVVDCVNSTAIYTPGALPTMPVNYENTVQSGDEDGDKLKECLDGCDGGVFKMTACQIACVAKYGAHSTTTQSSQPATAKMRFTTATAVAVLAAMAATVHGDCAASCRGLTLRAKANCLANCGSNEKHVDRAIGSENDDYHPSQAVQDCIAKHCDDLTFTEKWQCMQDCSYLDAH